MDVFVRIYGGNISFNEENDFKRRNWLILHSFYSNIAITWIIMIDTVDVPRFSKLKGLYNFSLCVSCVSCELWVVSHHTQRIPPGIRHTTQENVGAPHREEPVKKERLFYWTGNPHASSKSWKNLFRLLDSRDLPWSDFLLSLLMR